jgi:hypothetical protein
VRGGNNFGKEGQMKTSIVNKTFAIALGLCLLSGTACNRAANTEATTARGATMGEIKNRFRERYMGLRMRLAEIARLLPPVGSVRNTVGAASGRGRLANLNPSPASENTALIAAEQLLDPGRVPPFEFFALDLPGCPVQCFQWLARETSSATSEYESRTEDEGGRMARAFEAGLARRYLVVYRAARYARPQVTVPETSAGTNSGGLRYTPGSVDLEVFIVDLESSAIVDSFRVSGATPREVRFSSQMNSNTGEMERRMLAQVEGQLRDDSRTNLFAALTERIGRTFEPPSNPMN